MSISQQIRIAAEAAKKAGASETSIAKAAGVSQPTLFRFLKGETVRSEVIDKLADYFGLSLSKSPPAKPAAKRGKK